MVEYKEIWKWSEGDFDDQGKLKTSAIMYAFQEVAAAHATQLDVGFDDMMADEHIWVLTKLRFKMYEDIKKDEIEGVEYLLETYPRPKKGITFFRDYYLYKYDSKCAADEDKERKLVAAGTSQWCIINFKTRRIERTNVDFTGECIDHEPFDGAIPKIKPKNMERIGEYTVTKDDLDVNRHLNNCRYADIMENILGAMDYDDFSIHFSKEATLGDKINILKGESAAPDSEGKTVVIGILEDETVIFQTEFSGSRFGK